MRPRYKAPSSGRDRRATSTAASANMSVPPRLAGWRGLPLILIGRPSTEVTITPRPYPARGSAVAKRKRNAGHYAVRQVDIGDDLLAQVGRRRKVPAPRRWRTASKPRGDRARLTTKEPVI